MSAMNQARFSELLDAYGADLERWPAAERGPAQAWLSASPESRSLRLQAALLDDALDQYTLAPPAAALRQYLLGAAVVPRQRSWRESLAELWRDLGGWHLAAPAFAASLALGAVLPLMLDESAVDLPDEDLIAAVQLMDELEWTP